MKKGNCKRLCMIVLLIIACFCIFSACNQKLRVELKVPTEIKIEDETLTWKSVKNADGYLIDIDGTEYRTKTNSLDVFMIINQPKVFEMKVMALGDWEKTMDSQWSDSYKYELKRAECQIMQNNNNELVVTDIRNVDPSGKVVIPTSIGGMDIVAIYANAFENKTELTGILLPDTVRSIGQMAFQNCTNLKRVHTTAVKIGLYAFQNCSSLQRIQLPPDLTELKAYTFYGCSSLETIEIPKSVNKIGGSVFGKCDNLTTITVSPENETFQSDGNSIVRKNDNALVMAYKGYIPDCVEIIEKYAFSGDSTLTELTIPGHVKQIKDNAVFDCENLTKVSFAEGVQRIAAVFENCPNLSKIELPASVEEVSRLAYRCDNLATITIQEENPVYKSENNCIIDKRTNVLLFGCKTSVIPQGVERIGAYAFYGSNIERVAIPDSVKVIEECAFYDCYNLQEVAFSEGLETIGRTAFALENETNCFSLYIVFPESLKTIEDGAFFKRAYMSVILRDSVESVQNAFTSATIYTSAAYDKVPVGWSLRSNDAWVYNCTLKEDGGNVYVHSLVYVGRKEVREEDEWGTTVHYILGSVIRADATLIPQRKGYTFRGWSLEENGEIVVGLRKIPEALGGVDIYYTLNRLALDDLPDNTVLYAVWEKNE